MPAPAADPGSPAVDPAAVGAIVFDLGNVLLTLDNDLYDGDWPDGIGADHEDFEAWVAGEGLWYAFETGQVAEADFVRRLGERLGLSPARVRAYWNALLVGLVPGMAAGLEVLRQRYPLYVLSNTNATHIDWVDAHARQTGLGDWRRFFEEVYTSYELHSVKPEPEIYRRAQARIGRPPAELLFVDDRAENVEAARAQGWQALHLTPGEDVFLRLEQLGVRGRSGGGGAS